MRAMNDENRRAGALGVLGKVAGGGALVALQAFALVWGVARLFGIVAFLRWWWGVGSVVAFALAVVLCEVPIVSHILATLGGVVAYGLAWYWSALIFAPEGVFGVAVLAVMLAAFPFVLLRELLRPSRGEGREGRRGATGRVRGR